MVGQGAVGVDPAVDDLGHDVGRDDVDPLEGGDERLLRGGQGQGDRGESGVGAPLGGDRVDRLAELGEPALAARRSRLHRLSGWPAVSPPRSPEGDVEPLVVEVVGELPEGRHADLDDVDAARREHRGLSPGRSQVRRGEARPDPRPVRVAQDVHELEPRGAVGVDPLERGHPELPGQRLGRRAPPGIAQDLGLQPEVDGTRGHVEGELLGRRVVLDEPRGEGQGDPACQPIGSTQDVALDDLRGERLPGPVQAGDAEHPEDRPLLASRRARPGPSAPRAGQRPGELDEVLDGTQIDRG